MADIDISFSRVGLGDYRQEGEEERDRQGERVRKEREVYLRKIGG